jgi:hypothetical protein
MEKDIIAGGSFAMVSRAVMCRKHFFFLNMRIMYIVLAPTHDHPI